MIWKSWKTYSTSQLSPSDLPIYLEKILIERQANQSGWILNAIQGIESNFVSIQFNSTVNK